MDKNLSRVMKKKEYKERSQPASRARLGLLEKKKDYVERAKDYHQKQDQLNRLKTKAFERNEDEFYFGMVNAETKDGVHHVEIGKKRSQSDLLRMKAEDLNYLNTIGQAEKQVSDLEIILSCMIAMYHPLPDGGTVATFPFVPFEPDVDFT